MPTPCPFCGRQPQVERCEPWNKSDGPQPWYAGCYTTAPVEHFVGGNGGTKAEAVEEWERQCKVRAPQAATK